MRWWYGYVLFVLLFVDSVSQHEACACDKPTELLLAIQNKNPAYKHPLSAPINPGL